MKIDSGLSHMLLAQQENLSQRTATPAPAALITPPPAAEQQPQPNVHTPRTAPKDIVEFQGIEIDLDNLPFEEEPDGADEDAADIRTLTPREMVDISMDLYVEGDLSFDDYSKLAFQAELHPDFEDTIGALTGDRSEPDRPRDFISEWEDRYNFERRYPSDDPRELQQIERILTVLHSLEAPTDFVA